MESVRRPPRPGRAKLPTGSAAAIQEPAPTKVEKRRAGKESGARAALADVSNTSALKSQCRPVRACVAKEGVDTSALAHESAVKPLKEPPQLQTAAKKTRGKVAVKVVSTPKALEEPKTTPASAKPKGSVAKSVRGWKAKEQVQLESKFGSEEGGDGKGSIAQGTMNSAKNRGVRPKPTGKKVQEPGCETSKPIIKETRTSKVKPECSQHESDGAQHGPQPSVSKASERSVGKRLGANPRENAGEAESRIKMTVTRRRREPVRGKTDTGDECSHGAASSSTSGVEDQDLNACTSIQKTNHVLKSVRKISQKEVKLKESQRESVSANRSMVKKGLVTEPCLEKPGATSVLKQARKILPKPTQSDMEGSVTGNGNGKVAKDAQSQTPSIEGGVTDANAEKPRPKPKGKKGLGAETGKRGEKGTPTIESSLSASEQDRLSGSQQAGTDSGHKNTYGILEELPTISLAAAQVPQTCRRNAARGARKAVNYAEYGDGDTAKVISLQKETPLKLDGQMSKKLGGVVQTINQTVSQTVRKGRKKAAGAKTVPEPVGEENDVGDSREDLQQRDTVTPSTVESSLEEEYERFKRERRVREDAGTIPQLTSTTNLRKPLAKSPVILATSTIPTVECAPLIEPVASVNQANNKPEEDLQTPACEATQGKVSEKKVKASSISGTQEFVQVSGESVNPHDSKNARGCRAEPISLSKAVEPTMRSELSTGLLLHRTPVQRGQKRGRKDTNNVETSTALVQPSEPESTLSNGTNPTYTSPLKLDVTPVVVCEDYDKEDEAANEFLDSAALEEQDHTCVDISGHELDDPLCKALASFEDADIPTKVKECCKALGKPSPLQAHALPFLLAGRDLIGISESAGHTLAYGVPALVHALKKKKSYVRKRASPMCLVLAPSSEHVQQITELLDKTFGSLRVKVGSASGNPEDGSGMNTVKPGVAVVVTMPDCLQKMLEDGSCSLALVSYLVLDGADCMLDSGFEAALRDICDQAPTCRQTGVFSSTWQPEVEQLVKDFVPKSQLVKVVIKNPVKVQEQPVEGQDVTQIVEVLEESERDTRLTALLRMFQKSKRNLVLVYVLYKEEALHVEGLLQQRGWKVAAVHGGIFEADRYKAVVSFRKGSSSVLVATDVAARGLDIPRVDYVINYSFPYTPEDYAVRLGRTGRTGRKGIMHTFFMPANQARAKELVEVLRAAGQDVPEELLKLTSPANKKPRIVY